MNQSPDDPKFSLVAYRTGAAGRSVPVLRGTGIRVQTLVIAVKEQQMSPAEFAENYALSMDQVEGALAFYAAHREEIDSLIDEEIDLAPSS
jgi:uncharacterized protein (DUF433 family)